MEDANEALYQRYRAEVSTMTELEMQKHTLLKLPRLHDQHDFKAGWDRIKNEKTSKTLLRLIDLCAKALVSVHREGPKAGASVALPPARKHSIGRIIAIGPDVGQALQPARVPIDLTDIVNAASPTQETAPPAKGRTRTLSFEDRVDPFPEGWNEVCDRAGVERPKSFSEVPPSNGVALGNYVRRIASAVPPAPASLGLLHPVYPGSGKYLMTPNSTGDLQAGIQTPVPTGFDDEEWGSGDHRTVDEDERGDVG